MFAVTDNLMYHEVKKMINSNNKAAAKEKYPVVSSLGRMTKANRDKGWICHFLDIQRNATFLWVFLHALRATRWEVYLYGSFDYDCLNRTLTAKNKRLS